MINVGHNCFEQALSEIRSQIWFWATLVAPLAADP